MPPPLFRLQDNSVIDRFFSYLNLKSSLTLAPVLTFKFCSGQQVEVADAVDHDVLLHLVVPLPVPHDVGLDVVADTPVFSLEGGGNVGRQHQTEGDEVLASGQVGTLGGEASTRDRADVFEWRIQVGIRDIEWTFLIPYQARHQAIIRPKYI